LVLRGMVRDTSLKAYIELKESGMLDARLRQVWEVALSLIVTTPTGKRFPTGSQIAKKDKALHTTAEFSESVRNRLTELVEKGWMKERGKVQCPITGKTVQTYEALRTQIPPKPKMVRPIVVPLKIEDFEYLYKLARESKSERPLRCVAQAIADFISDAVADAKMVAGAGVEPAVSVYGTDV
jgi:hypothetical protein